MRSLASGGVAESWRRRLPPARETVSARARNCGRRDGYFRDMLQFQHAVASCCFPATVAARIDLVRRRRNRRLDTLELVDYASLARPTDLSFVVVVARVSPEFVGRLSGANPGTIGRLSRVSRRFTARVATS
jgi:hypothetical protein